MKLCLGTKGERKNYIYSVNKSLRTYSSQEILSKKEVAEEVVSVWNSNEEGSVDIHIQERRLDGKKISSNRMEQYFRKMAEATDEVSFLLSQEGEIGAFGNYSAIRENWENCKICLDACFTGEKNVTDVIQSIIRKSDSIFDDESGLLRMLRRNMFFRYLLHGYYRDYGESNDYFCNREIPDFLGDAQSIMDEYWQISEENGFFKMLMTGSLNHEKSDMAAIRSYLGSENREDICLDVDLKGECVFDQEGIPFKIDVCVKANYENLKFGKEVNLSVNRK